MCGRCAAPSLASHRTCSLAHPISEHTDTTSNGMFRPTHARVSVSHVKNMMIILIIDQFGKIKSAPYQKGRHSNGNRNFLWKQHLFYSTTFILFVICVQCLFAYQHNDLGKASFHELQTIIWSIKRQWFLPNTYEESVLMRFTLPLVSPKNTLKSALLGSVRSTIYVYFFTIVYDIATYFDGIRNNKINWHLQWRILLIKITIYHVMFKYFTMGKGKWAIFHSSGAHFQVL